MQSVLSGENMKKKVVKYVFLGIGGLALVFLIVLSGFFIAEPQNRKKYELTAFESIDLSDGGDRIHFLETGGSDAILLESDGRFALVDSGEDSDNPRGFENLDYTGYETRVVNYLEEVAGGEDGKVYLDFVVGTHAHSDHIGGFDTVILDEDITVGVAYLKEYDASKIKEKETRDWDNQEVYDQMVAACEARGVEIISDVPHEAFLFGNMKITFFNTKPLEIDNIGENENSLGVLVEVDGQKAFLAGDINNIEGTESAIKDEIGEVDLLKLGHHGYDFSSSVGFLQTLHPEVAIVTNSSLYVNLGARMTLTSFGCPFYPTVNYNGIVAEFKDGEIKLYDDLHRDEIDYD